MNYGPGYPGQAKPKEFRLSAQKSQEALQGEQKGGRSSRKLWPCPQISPQLRSIFPRYSILPHSDPERCFSIEPEAGTLRTVVPLDREARVWHNLTVLATELGEEPWAPWRGRRPQSPGRGAVPEPAGGRRSLPPCLTRAQHWVPSLDHHHQAGLPVSEAGLAWARRICLHIPLT